MCICHCKCDGPEHIQSKQCCCNNPKPQFKVGDRVYSLLFGWGVVEQIRGRPAGWVDVKHTKHSDCSGLATQTFGYIYYPDGKIGVEGDQVLFHDKPTIIPAKKKVKKWYWVYQYGGGFGLTSAPKSETEILPYNSGPNKTKILWTEIEVEE